jgi:hypothetical protein
MFDVRRLFGRLFLLVLLLGGITWAQGGPALTTVNDTVFRADGTPAGGTLLISWQSFTSADRQLSTVLWNEHATVVDGQQASPVEPVPWPHRCSH